MTGDNIEHGYSAYYGIWRGVVVDIADPLKRGRVRVKIFGYMDDITQKQYESIPWAVPKMPLSSGGDTCGEFKVPNVGTYVYGFFEGGNHMLPVYDGIAVDGVHNVPAFAATNYPQRKGVAYANDVVMYVDESNDEVKFVHPSGTTVTVSQNGDIAVSCANDCTVTVAEDCTVTAKNVTINGSETIHATTAELTANVSGDATLTASGAVAISGSTINLN